MKIPIPLRALPALAAGIIITALPASGALKNRYSFNEAPGSTTVIDSVSGSNGVVRVLSTTTGTLPTFDGNQVTLDGVGGYIDLPNRLVSSLTNITMEMWVTWTSGGTWTRLLDFGNNSNGEDTDGTKASGTGNNYMFISANAGGTPRFAITPASNGNENPIVNSSIVLAQNVESYVVVTYGPAGARMFIDGVQVGSGNYNTPLSSVQDTNNWLGRSNWPDPFYGGSFNEFRIHDSLLTQLQILASKAAGPTTINYTPENPTSIALVVQSPMTLGTSQTPSLNATFPTYGSVTLGAGDATFTSSATNIIRVDTNNNNLVAVSAGTANITASLGGQSNTVPVTVIPPIVFTALKHRYSFNEANGSPTANDSVGGASFAANVYPPVDTNAPVVISNGVAVFPGGTYQTSGYIALPAYMISSEFTNITVEVWVTWTGTAANNTWGRVFDFGSSAKGSDPHVNAGGQTYIMFTPYRGGGGGGRNEFRAAAPDTTAYVSVFNDQPGSIGFTPNKEVHVVSEFAPGIGYSALYIDGIIYNIGATPKVGTPATNFQFNSTQWDPNMWLGVSQYADPPFNGKINELRLHEGILDEMKIALSRKAGPDALPIADPGTLQGVALQPIAPALLGNPALPRVTLLGNYANVTGLEITGFNNVQYVPGDTNIFTISTDGLITARAAGTTSLIASYGGFSSTNTVTVLAPTALRSDIVTTNAGGLTFTLRLFADFTGTNNVNVTAFTGVTRVSSDTNSAVINNAGLVTYVGNPGTPTITSTYGGLTNSTTLTIVALPPRTLLHRWSFSEAPNVTTNVHDSVGTADGQIVNLQTNSTLYGNFTGTGQFVMGPGPQQEPPTTNAYVNLPNGLISGLSNVTVEGWYSWFGGGNNQRFFDFGMSSGATNELGVYLEDVVGGVGRSYFFLSPQTGQPRFAMKQGTGAETPSMTAPTAYAITGSSTNLTHVAVVYDLPRGVARLYVNGRRSNVAAASLPLSVVDDRNNWIGRSQWGDPFFNGSVDEFRIYSGPSSDADIAADYAAGPNALVASRPTLTFSVAGNQLTLSWPVAAGAFTLQKSASLGTGASWSSAGAPTVVGSNNQVTVPITGDATFFRLQQ